MLRRRRLLPSLSSPPASLLPRVFRSDASLEAIRSHSSSEGQAGPAHLVLYNYPTLAGAYAALAAHLFHRRLHRLLPVLSFSSVDLFRAGDFEAAGFQTCYLLDFIGPKKFALEFGAHPIRPQDICESLLDQEDEGRVSNVLKYIEDADLRQWQLAAQRNFIQLSGMSMQN